MPKKKVKVPAPEDIPQPVAGEIDLAGSERPDIARYLNVRTASAPTLAPDGKRLAFLTRITGEPQLWVTAVGEKGGWPQQLTFGESVTFADWSPTGNWIAYGSDRAGNEREGFYLISPEGTFEDLLVAPSDVFREWGGWSQDGTCIAFTATEEGSDDFDVYTMKVGRGEAKRVYEGSGGLYVAAWRPDGDALLLVRSRGADSNDVLLLDLRSGVCETLLAPEEPAEYGSLAWKADGSGFYTVSNEGRDLAGVAFFEMKTRELRWLETGEREVEQLDVSEDGRYLAWTENDGGLSRLFVRDLRTGTTLRRFPLPAGVIDSIEWARRDHQLAVEISAHDIPGDVWVLDVPSSEAVRATHSTLAGLDPARFVEPQGLTFAARDGETLHGLLYLPAKGDAPPPVLLALHGGPTDQARPDFHAVYQYLLTRGFAVFDLNFRGSTGFGKRFARLDDGRLRRNAITDMADAVDFLAADGRVDAKRVAAMGGSYGGFMTLAALSMLPERFRAGISIVGVSNWVTALSDASPQLKASDLVEYGDLSDPEDRAFLIDISPLTHASKIAAPLMVIHGANDPRDPVSEADQIVQAVRQRGGEAEYLRFPDEGHGIRKLSNRIIAYRRVASFLERTLIDG